MQRGVSKKAEWARENGFKFSKSKTVMMQFYKTRAPVLKPKICLDNNLIPEVDTFKFMGQVWDPKLTLIPHIAQLKERCMKTMNLLRIVTSQSWGADMEIGMRLYRAIIRSKIYYGSIVYGAANAATLKSLEVVANEAMRSGAFKTTPVGSMQVINSEPPLELRRIELLLLLLLLKNVSCARLSESDIHLISPKTPAPQ